MLRDVVVHLANDQPLLADLFAIPQPSDSSLVCTNLRTLSGKTPSFVAEGGSTFLFPLQHVRFVEVPERAIELARTEAESEGGADAAAHDLRETTLASGVRRNRHAKSGAEPDARRLPAPGEASGGRRAEPVGADALDQPPEVAAGLRELASVASAFAELAQVAPVDAAAPPVPAAWDGDGDDGEDEEADGEDGSDDEAYTADLLRRIREA